MVVLRNEPNLEGFGRAGCTGWSRCTTFADRTQCWISRCDLLGLGGRDRWLRRFFRAVLDYYDFRGVGLTGDGSKAALGVVVLTSKLVGKVNHSWFRGSHATGGGHVGLHLPVGTRR